MPSFPSTDWAEAVVDTVNEDSQFQRIARHWDATLLFEVEDATFALTITDGTVTELHESTEFVSWDVAVRAPADVWETFLSESPPPFYNDLRSVWTQHDMTIEGDVVSAFQHWRPLKYLVDTFGEVAT